MRCEKGGNSIWNEKRAERRRWKKDHFKSNFSFPKSQKTCLWGILVALAAKCDVRKANDVDPSNTNDAPAPPYI